MSVFSRTKSDDDLLHVWRDICLSFSSRNLFAGASEEPNKFSAREKRKTAVREIIGRSKCDFERPFSQLVKSSLIHRWNEILTESLAPFQYVIATFYFSNQDTRRLNLARIYRGLIVASELWIVLENGS